jgi:membrane-associated HD superfamily phosphohydrolase
MNTLRKIVVGLAGFTCVLAISGFVSLLALETTVMDQTVVKGWLSSSKIYDGRLVSLFADGIASADEQNNPQQTNIAASPAALKTALNATFTPDFVQAQVEGIIANAYDWTEAKSPEFTFSIPVDQKRDELIQQLAKAIEPQIAALPICESVLQSQQSTCRPPTVTVEQFSNQVTTQGVDRSGIFEAPITSESVTKNKQPDSSLLAQLPAIRKAIDILLYVLPIVAIASIATVIFVTVRERRLLAASRLSRRIFISMLLIFIPAIAAVWIMGNNDSTIANVSTTQIGDLVIPLVKIAVTSVSSQLALFSGIVCAVSLTAWIGFIVWRRKRRTAEATQVPTSTPPVVSVGAIPPSPQPPQDIK